MDITMNYYKDSNGNVYAYDDEQVSASLASDKTPMTLEEVEAHINPPPTLKQIQEQTNSEARSYLLSTDWYIVRHQETSQPVPEEVLEARSQARSRVVPFQ